MLKAESEYIKEEDRVMNIKHKSVISVAIIFLLVIVPVIVSLLAIGVEWLEILKLLGALLVAFIIAIAFSLIVGRLVRWILDDNDQDDSADN